MNDLRPIRDDVWRLGRVPEVDPQVLEARRVWREAVGEQVAANSLPVRRSGDALVVHCASSGWASELTLLERQIALRRNAYALHRLTDMGQKAAPAGNAREHRQIHWLPSAGPAIRRRTVLALHDPVGLRKHRAIRHARYARDMRRPL